MSFENIPTELRLYNSWCLWRYEEKENGEKTKVPYQLSGQKCSPTDPTHWASFDSIANYKTKLNGHSGYDGIGFVLSNMDPFAVIDLDYTEDQEKFKRQQNIYDNFNSYSEISPSGKGLHIVTYGSVPSGRKREKVELYSSQRYICFTGQVFNNAPIAHRQELLDILWAEMGPETPVYDLQAISQKEIFSDNEILKQATNATNGEKFTKLILGDWSSAGYPSQSEADFAIIDMFAFYTQNIDQIKRLWHMSALSKRNKQTSIKGVPYLDHMINRAFDRQLPFVDLSSIKVNGISLDQSQIKEGVAPGNKATPSHGTGEQAQAMPGIGALVGEANTLSNAAAAKLVAQAIAVKMSPPQPTWPPGLLGQIAHFIYNASDYPCYEIAMAGAIGLMAGICGRAYNVSRTGLNLYIVFLAVTGTGKESASSGITKLMAKTKKTIPNADTFIGPGDIRSEQALVKYLTDHPSFVSIYSEFGNKLKQMNSNHNENALGLRSIMLKLYNKSGFNDELGKIIYSDKDKNTKNLLSPAFTLLAESTPEEYYSAIDENLISDGFLNRFITFEYKGKRPLKNKFPVSEVPVALEQALNQLISVCLSKNGFAEPINVIIDPEAQALFDRMEDHLTDVIDNSSSELLRKLWVRSTVKAMKLAAIPAVGINCMAPVIDYACAKWAYDLIVADTEMMAQRFNLGAVGEKSLVTYSSDSNQLDDMVKIIGKWLKKTEKPNRVDDKMLASGVYTFSALQMRVASTASFRNDKVGSTAAFKRALQTLLDSGDIIELNAMQVANEFGKRAKCFKIVDYDRFA